MNKFMKYLFYYYDYNENMESLGDKCVNEK